MRVQACVLVSMVAGCGLIKVNGKPLGGSSSAPSPSATSASSSEPSSEQTKAADPEAQESHQASSEMPSAQPAVAKAEQPPQEEVSGTKSLDDFASPGKKHGSWSPLQQYEAIVSRQPYAAIIIADELGDQLSQAGRLGLIDQCFESTSKNATASSLWAACGADVKAFDVNALRKELQKEGLTTQAREEFLAKSNETLTEANAIGAAVMDAAKGDPGVAAIVEMGKTARAEWKAFAADHPDQLAELAKLQDLVRENKNGLAGDCIDKTRPAMETVVRATKWHEQDNPVFPAEYFVNQTPATTEAFIATLAWTACAALTHQAGNTLYAAAMDTDYGYSQERWRRYHRRGPRSLTVAKLYQDSFKPKFADRSLDMRKIAEPRGGYSSGLSAEQTPDVAVVGKLVKNGDETTIKFANDKVMACTDWRDTNHVRTISTSGELIYDKKCMRREAVDNEHSDVVTATAFTSGLAPGVEVTTEYSFPIVGMKRGKFVAALGIKL